jgi:uncharacterized protein (UPF0335 family)
MSSSAIALLLSFASDLATACVAGVSRPEDGAGYLRARSVVNHLSVWLAGLTHWLFFCGHFRTSIYQGGTMSDVTIPGGKIRAFVERIENIDTELQELNEQKKEVFAEAKGEGFDVKILKEIIKLRKQDEEERDERESMLDLYMRAMEQAGPENVAKAA